LRNKKNPDAKSCPYRPQGADGAATLQDIITILGVDELSETEKLTISRAKLFYRYLKSFENPGCKQPGRSGM
jgi:hypothetical protein